MSNDWMFDPRAEEASMQEQAQEQYEAQYAAWRESQLEEGASQEASSQEAYDEYLVDRAEGAAESLAWAKGCW